MTAMTKTRVQDLFVQTRARSCELASPLSAEDCMLQSMPDASPTKWHLAHTSWFFDIFILEPLDQRQCDDDFKVMFNSYYQGIGKQHRRAERGMLSRPSLDEVYNYRRLVDEAVMSVLNECTDISILQLVELGCHHEMQHQELLVTDIQHALWQNPTPATPYAGTDIVKSTQPQPLNRTNNHWLEFEGGIEHFGFDSDSSEDFHFDNEEPRHRQVLEPFALATTPVTNGEYIEFIEDKGYQSTHLWHDKGWALLRQLQWQLPEYWCKDGDRYYQYQCDSAQESQEVDPNEPVCHINWYEASAYANWRGHRLPTEFETEMAMQSDSSADSSDSWGQVWEWTQSAYSPYPNFKPSAGAVGEYNGKFMIDQMVLRGGSRFTPKGHCRPTYRNFFPAETRWQCSGVRLAK